MTVNGFAFTASRFEHLINAFGIVLNQRICHLQNISRRSIVFFELHHGFSLIIFQAIAEVILEPHENGEIRATEGINRLIRVTHHEDRSIVPSIKGCGIFTVGRQHLNQVVLRSVRILIFINQNVSKPLVPVTANLFILFEQFDRHQD